MRVSKLTDEELKKKMIAVNMYLLDYSIGIMLMAAGIYSFFLYGTSQNTPYVFFVPGLIIFQCGYFKALVREYFRRIGCSSEISKTETSAIYSDKPLAYVKYHLIAIACFIAIALFRT